MRFAALKALLKNRNYVIYSAGNAVSLTGTWIHGIAFAWLVWQMTHSPFWLGAVATAGLAPTLFAGLIGGVMADRMDRLRLTILTQIISFVLTMGLFILYSLDAINIWLLILFKILLSTAVAISQPARMALIPTLVGPSQVGPAVSFGSLVFNVARFIGPAIAGLIIATAGIGAAFLINSLTFIAMTAAILSLRLPEGFARKPESTKPKESMLAQLKESAAYVRAHGGVLTMFVLLIVAVVFVRPISDFLPAIVTHVHGRGVEGVAIFTSCVAAGSIVGGIWTAGRDVSGLTQSSLRSAAIYAGCIAVFVITPSFLAGCLIFATAGFFASIFTISTQTLIQASVEDDMRGRVMSLFFIISRGGPDLGALLIGIGGELAGLPIVFILGAMGCIVTCGVAWRRRDQLARALEHIKPIYTAAP